MPAKDLVPTLAYVEIYLKPEWGSGVKHQRKKKRKKRKEKAASHHRPLVNTWNCLAKISGTHCSHDSLFVVHFTGVILLHTSHTELTRWNSFPLVSATNWNDMFCCIAVITNIDISKMLWNCSLSACNENDQSKIFCDCLGLQKLPIPSYLPQKELCVNLNAMLFKRTLKNYFLTLVLLFFIFFSTYGQHFKEIAFNCCLENTMSSNLNLRLRCIAINSLNGLDAGGTPDCSVSVPCRESSLWRSAGISEQQP